MVTDDHEGLTPEKWIRKYPQGEHKPIAEDVIWQNTSRAICKRYGYHRAGGFDMITGLAWAYWKKDGPMFHINFATDEQPAYPWTFAYVSRFQEGLSRVAENQSECCHYHIEPDGGPTYSQRYSHVGLFFEELAEAENETGRFHIKPNGKPAYRKRFIDVGHFCGGLSQAEDETGCYHIWPDGSPAYNSRFRFCGPFNKNGLAAAKILNKKRGLVRVQINRQGEII